MGRASRGVDQEPSHPVRQEEKAGGAMWGLNRNPVLVQPGLEWEWEWEAGIMPKQSLLFQTKKGI
jgi:hypothetical protein